MFGLFSDSCPDRWGRLLMKRKEAIVAKEENRKPRSLLESDYLLAVNDESRMGGIRFKTREDGSFVASNSILSIPPWTSLRTLENASLEFEGDGESLEEQWLQILLIPGSSLGGARPKSSVKSPDGSLWIAKFPSKYDEYDSGAWEKVVHDLARLCSLKVPESKLEAFSEKGSTFIVKRFDRNNERRIHFASAMNLLGKGAGASAQDGTSYLDIASYITAFGSNPNEDLLELWKRIIFNMAVSNTDDHLRNHGFLLTPTGWRISPFFDVNPIPAGSRLSLNVNHNDNLIDLELAMEVAPFFGITMKSASRIIDEIITVIQDNWIKTAKYYGLSKKSIEFMRPAFSLTT